MNINKIIKNPTSFAENLHRQGRININGASEENNNKLVRWRCTNGATFENPPLLQTSKF